MNGSWGCITYTYDAVGNRLTDVRFGVPAQYTYGSYNRLTQAVLTGFSYDNAGNMVSRYNWTGYTWNYTYNVDNMLKTVVKNGSFAGEYFYDGDGKRVKKVENVDGSNTTTIYIYGRGLNALYEVDV